MLKFLDKSIKKSLCFVPKAVHHSLLIEREIGVSVCDKNFCLCDNLIKKMMKEQKLNLISVSIEKENFPTQDDIKIIDKEINQKMRSFKCD